MRRQSGPPVITPESRHKDTSTSRPTVTRSAAEALTNPLLAAAELVDDLTTLERHKVLAYRWGYRDGFASGEAIGTQRAERELTAMWDSQAEHVHTVTGQRAYAELERIRWDGRREDFGQPRAGDFKGFGADYEPSSHLEAARRRESAA